MPRCSTSPTREQLQTLPTSGRAFQSFMTLMPGVADPNYQQSGGINNPGRTMSLTDQRPAGDQHRRPARRHHRHQSVLREHPELRPRARSDRDRQRRDEQLRCRPGHGRRRRRERAGEDRHEHLQRLGLRVRRPTRGCAPATISCRPDQTKGTSSVHVFGGTIGGPIVKNKLFFFFSDETTIQRTFKAATPRGRPAPTASSRCRPRTCARGDFSGSGHGHLRSAHRQSATGAGRVPFAFANCPGLSSTTDPRFASCNFIPAEPHQPDRGERCCRAS